MIEIFWFMTQEEMSRIMRVEKEQANVVHAGGSKKARDNINSFRFTFNVYLYV
jgi:hypothetical protein